MILLCFAKETNTIVKMPNRKEWFDEWFNSPFYHVLYKNRNHAEAQSFIQKLSQHLQFKSSDKILDLACGKGRHSIFLNQQGFDTVGVDLSEESINYAKQFENDRLEFVRHDMRNVFRSKTFDYVLNMFTSFGYFSTEEENLIAINATAQSLKDGGKLVLDFFNTDKVIRDLVPYEVKKIEGISFEIRKEVENRQIIKHIDFEYDGKGYHFSERVMAITREMFVNYFTKAGLTPIDSCEKCAVFGDYELNEFDAEKSDRMIFIVQK